MLRPEVIFCLLFVNNCRGSAHFLTCPEMTHDTASCESVESWLCGSNEWLGSVKDWKETVEEVCSEEDLGSQWKEIFSCPDTVTVECVNKTATSCGNGPFNCTICYCQDGKYKDRQNYLHLWKKHQETFRKAMMLYKEKIKFCGQRTACTETDEVTTTSMETTDTTQQIPTDNTPTTDTTTTETTNVVSTTIDATADTTQKIPTGNTQTMDTPTTEATTVASTTIEATTEACHVTTVDLVFVLDGSESVHGHFGQMQDFVKNVTKSLARQMELDYIHIGVVQYSHYYGNRPLDQQQFIVTEIEIGEFKLYEDFSDAVDRILLHNYTTYTGRALEKVAADFNTSTRFNTTNNKQIMLLVTDGRSTDPDHVGKNAEALRRMGVITYAVGVKDAEERELRLIATGDETSMERVYMVERFDQLDSLVDSIQAEILTICKK